MSLLGKLKTAMSSKANDVITKALDPAKEIELIIVELEQTNLEARKELLSYKTSTKRIQRDIDRAEAQLTQWEARAKEAVKAGDDELAKDALRRKRELEREKKQLIADRNEAATYAIELNKSRKQVQTRLQMLKLKKHTITQQLVAHQTGGKGGDNDVWDRMAQAERAIEEQAITAEIDDLLGVSDDKSAEALAAVERQTNQLGADSALAQLKARMAADKANESS